VSKTIEGAGHSVLQPLFRLPRTPWQHRFPGGFWAVWGSNRSKSLDELHLESLAIT